MWAVVLSLTVGLGAESIKQAILAELSEWGDNWEIMTRYFGDDSSLWPYPGVPFTTVWIAVGGCVNHLDHGTWPASWFMVLPLFSAQGGSALLFPEVGTGVYMQTGDACLFRADQLLHSSTDPDVESSDGARIMLAMWIDKSVIKDMIKHDKNRDVLTMPITHKKCDHEGPLCIR